MNGIVGLDFPAVIQFATLAGPLSPAAADLMTASLPEVEGIIVQALRKETEE